jgi:hypothetical protein
MRCKALVLCLALAVLSGCGGLPKSKEWTHPRMADPRREDRQFLEDSKFCEDKIGVQPQGQERSKAMADCLTRLGWQRKE